MPTTDANNQPAPVAASNVIPFPGKSTRRLRTAKEKRRLRLFKLVLLQALRKAKELVLGRTRPAKQTSDRQKYGVSSESAAAPSVRLRAQA